MDETTLYGNTSYWLRRAYLMMRKAMDEAVVQYGLTAVQLDVLMYLWHNDGMEQRALQEQMSITSATLTGIVDSMVERGFVARRLSPDDARVKQLFLTEGGRLLHDQLGSAADDFDQRLVKGFSRTEVALLRDWLHRLTNNASELVDS